MDRERTTPVGRDDDRPVHFGRVLRPARIERRGRVVIVVRSTVHRVARDGRQGGVVVVGDRAAWVTEAVP